MSRAGVKAPERRAIALDPVLIQIELAIATIPNGDFRVGARWEGLVAARKYRLAELTGERDGYRRWTSWATKEGARARREYSAALVARWQREKMGETGS